MADDREFGYGPTPEGAQHEHSDIEPGIARSFAVWLAVAMVISAGIVYGTFWFFEGVEDEADRAAQVFPLAAGRDRTPPSPRLQTQPFKDVYLLRQNEAQVLTTYGWVDRDNGVVRVPIERAMELILEQGLPVRADANAEGLGMVVQDSSSGRTASGR